MRLINPEFHKNIKKQKCLCTNLSGDFIGLMTTVNYISSQKLTLCLKQSFQAVLGFDKNIIIFDFIT